ncbi:transmembrane protein, putative [Medicago truncatula]|uniref:Transmembrane protein, putative n=1 Tax=Medicago truncatula TaxID=3880 RepID=G7JT31_MEDTR|nr:transmembrane protein, putative [Medicago truncatula]
MDMELRLFTDMPFIGGFVFELANCGAATSVITGYTLWSHYYIQLGLVTLDIKVANLSDGHECIFGLSEFLVDRNDSCMFERVSQEMK